jgi:hypothetical protein
MFSLIGETQVQQINIYITSVKVEEGWWAGSSGSAPA